MLRIGRILIVGFMFALSCIAQPETPAKSLADLRKAADSGDVNAQYGLGLLLEDEGAAQDYAQAAKWFRKVAEQGHAWAQTKLGLFNHNGRGVEQNDRGSGEVVP